MSTKRKLAAILSADAAGYSKLMADDDAATLRSLNDARALFRKRIEAHGGRLIDTAGDSVLGEFPSAVEAVDCTVEIQHELAKRNSQLAEHRRMQFRIGVNLGDVIEQEDGTIYGDGVNVAARLQTLSLEESASPVPRLTMSKGSSPCSSSSSASSRSRTSPSRCGRIGC